MIKNIKGVNINYIDYGSGDNTLVLLHGWGQNIEMMKPIGDKFKKNNRIIILDLPGFGNSEEPSFIWTINDYTEAIYELLASIKANNIILIGHSFGGKIALEYASKYKVEKLILFGSPFKKAIQKLSLKTRLLKKLKKVPILKNLEKFAKKHMGSKDYRDASEIMRKIMVQHVNLDITNDVKKIKCPTIILWGDNDEAVPLNDAYELEKLIPDSAVILYPGCTHYAYLENLPKTISIIKNFIGG